jgi:hypothetical protein
MKSADFTGSIVMTASIQVAVLATADADATTLKAIG